MRKLIVLSFSTLALSVQAQYKLVVDKAGEVNDNFSISRIEEISFGKDEMTIRSEGEGFSLLIDDVRNMTFEPVDVSLNSLTFDRLLNGLKNDYNCEIRDDTVFIRLNEYADVERLIPRFDINGSRLMIGGNEVSSDNSTVSFRDDMKLSVYDEAGYVRDYVTKVIPYSPTGLPVLYIWTEGKETVVSKDYYLKGTFRIQGNELFPATEEVALEIKGRGNSTWQLPKKPYALKLKSAVSVLGMPAHKRWVLLANWMDRTLMRNRISLLISEKTGLAWTPRNQYVEVIMNGKHTGNYLLTEHIKVDPNRVNIKSLKAGDTEEPAITGGYLMEFDTNYDEVNKFRTDAPFNLPAMFKEPDEETLNTRQFDYMKNYINGVQALIASGRESSYEQIAEMIDINSFIDWWLVYELSGNKEPQHPKSTYMHKDREGALTAGPVWDFDWGTYVAENASSFINTEYVWYGYLFRFPQFKAAVKARWAELLPAFETVKEEIDFEKDYLASSWEMNDPMWPLSAHPFGYENKDHNLNYDEATTRLKQNYTQKLEFLKIAIPNL